jgi:hypothetical protein
MARVHFLVYSYLRNWRRLLGGQSPGALQRLPEEVFRELDSLDFPHEVAVMAIMAIVVVILRNFTVHALPHFLPQPHTVPGSSQEDSLLDDLFTERMPSNETRHVSTPHLPRRSERVFRRNKLLSRCIDYGGGGGSRTRVRESPP